MDNFVLATWSKIFQKFFCYHAPTYFVYLIDIACEFPVIPHDLLRILMAQSFMAEGDMWFFSLIYMTRNFTWPLYFVDSIPPKDESA